MFKLYISIKNKLIFCIYKLSAQKLIELDKQIKISKPVIKKIWEGNY